MAIIQFFLDGYYPNPPESEIPSVIYSCKNPLVHL